MDEYEENRLDELMERRHAANAHDDSPDEDCYICVLAAESWERMIEEAVKL